jgi:chaperonin GroES
MRKINTPLKLSEIIAADNVAELIEENDLALIASDLLAGVQMDSASMDSWKKQYCKLVESAMLVAKEKTEPIGAMSSNVKVPVITQALLQFVARAYPAFVDGNRVVKCSVTGDDPDGEKAGRGKRISEHMSYQLLEEMEDWESDTDKLLLALANGGTAFRKIWWNADENRPESKYLPIDNIIFDNNGDSLKTLHRVTHAFYLRPREIEERIRAGAFIPFEYTESGGGGTRVETVEIRGNTTQNESTPDTDAPQLFYETHTFLDLDGDGYQEPYIVTFHPASQKTLRIDIRFYEDEIRMGKNNTVQKITATEHFVAYTLFPGFTGFLGVGIGTILYPMTESMATLINQLTDAGTMSNQPAGFVNGLFSGNKGTIRYRPGEIQSVTGAMSGTVRDAFHFIPIAPPSMVLFQLLGFISDSAEKVSMSSNLLAGASPSGNQPATTTVALIGEGQKSFSGIMKRVLKSAKKEFRLLFELNKRYLQPQVYASISDNNKVVQKTDYEGDGTDVQPQADLSMITDTSRTTMAQALLQMVGQPGINPNEIQKYVLETMRVENPERFLVPPPQPQDHSQDPAALGAMAELEIKAKKLALDTAIAAVEMELKKAQTLKTEAEAMQVSATTRINQSAHQQAAGERILAALNQDPIPPTAPPSEPPVTGQAMPPGQPSPAPAEWASTATPGPGQPQPAQEGQPQP